MNVHFQCLTFDRLLSDGKVLPVAPLWSHFQHTIFPRPYSDWIEYDQEMLLLYDACLRLDAILSKYKYRTQESAGADAEVETFKKMGKPVFYSISDLYEWVSSAWTEY